MKPFTLIFLCFLFLNKAYSQITRDNWMLGGNADFSITNSKGGDNNTKTTTINLAPDIGYFFADKFAGGIRLSFSKTHIKYRQPFSNSNFTNFTNYGIGPFVRYYILPVDNQYNIITEISYQFGNEKVETSNSLSSTNSNKLSFSAGPVIYFNTSVGIEFLLNYTSSGNNLNSNRSDSFGIGIGLQIHLQKHKN